MNRIGAFLKKVSIFDLAVLVLALIAGILAWTFLHGSASCEASMTPEAMLEDILRADSKYNDPEDMNRSEYYNIDCRIRMENISMDYAENYPELGSEICDAYSGSRIGTLQGCEMTEHGDGTMDVCITLRIYAMFFKNRIQTPQCYEIRAGKVISLQGQDGYLGTGTITWISH